MRDLKLSTSRPQGPLVRPINISYFLGGGPTGPQDSFMYRIEHGFTSVLLDDDNCDCVSSFSLGHGMCDIDTVNTFFPQISRSYRHIEDGYYAENSSKINLTKLQIQVLCQPFFSDCSLLR